MGNVIVLVTKGKGQGKPDFAKVTLFTSHVLAEKYVEETVDLDSKYWTNAQIVEDEEEVELFYPEGY